MTHYHEWVAFSKKIVLDDIAFGTKVFAIASIWKERTRWPFKRLSLSDISDDVDEFIEGPGRLIEEFQSHTGVVCEGRLASVVEGGGKRRIFAIGNYVMQRLLKPYHDWAMQVLRRLECDGTYDQTKPLQQIKGCKDLYSYDLKSATDLFPRMVIFQVLGSLFDQFTASVVDFAGLGVSAFDVNPPLVKKRSKTAFAVGQPLGFYSSWPLFTLSHHVIVWLAAERVYPRGKVFKAYALLGDDIVIADSRVAEEYRKILQSLEVKISIPKSLISNSGAFEFAKRFFVREGSVDISPISARMLLMCRSSIGLSLIRNKYQLPFKTLLRLGGAGYRVLARADTHRSSRWERLWVILSKPDRKSPLPFRVMVGLRDTWGSEDLPVTGNRRTNEHPAGEEPNKQIEKLKESTQHQYFFKYTDLEPTRAKAESPEINQADASKAVSKL